MKIKVTFLPPQEDGSRIQCIKEIRQLSECGLKEAKDFCDKHFYIVTKEPGRYEPVHARTTSLEVCLTPEQYSKYTITAQNTPWEELRTDWWAKPVILEDTPRLFLPSP